MAPFERTALCREANRSQKFSLEVYKLAKNGADLNVIIKLKSHHLYK